MWKIAAADVRLATRHAIGSYLFWLPTSIILIVLIMLGGTPIFLVLAGIVAEAQRSGATIVAALLLIITSIFVYGLIAYAQWVTIRLSLRYPWRIQHAQPLQFAALSTGIYILLLIIMRWIFHLAEPQGYLSALLFGPFYAGNPVSFPLYVNVIGIFVFTFLSLRQGPVKKVLSFH